MEKSGQVIFCPGELILKLLARIGEWHENVSEYTAAGNKLYGYMSNNIKKAQRAFHVLVLPMAGQ